MKKQVWFCFVVLLTVFSLIACQPTGVAPAEQPAGQPESAGGVSLRFWVHQNDTFNQGYQDLINAYTANHPNVSITLETFEYETYIQTLQTALPAGQEADILQLFGTWVCSYASRLAPVPANVMTIDQASGIFYEAPLGGFICENTLYGLPQEFNIEYGGVLVNKAMFEEAGLVYPPAWKTLDDVTRDAVKLTKVGSDGIMTVAGLHFTSTDAMNFIFLSGIKQRGGDYWNADRTGFQFTTPEARQTIEWMKGMVDAGVVDPVIYNNENNWVGDAFFGGTAAMGYIGPWAVSLGLMDFPDFGEFGYFVLPHVGPEPVFVADSGWGLTVSQNSKHQDVAWDFIKFVTANEESALQWNITSSTIPAMPSAAQSKRLAEELPWITEELTQLPYGDYIGRMPDRDQVFTNILYPHLLSVLQGVESIDDALQMMENEANGTFR